MHSPENKEDSPLSLDDLVHQAEARFYSREAFPYEEKLVAMGSFEASGQIICELEVSYKDVALLLISESRLQPQEIGQLFDSGPEEFETWDDMWREIAVCILHQVLINRYPDIKAEAIRRTELYD